MSEEILGVVKVNRVIGHFGRTLDELCFFTANRIIVARVESIGASNPLYVGLGAIGGTLKERQLQKKREELGKLVPDELLKADENNVALPYAEIRKIELKKFFRGAKLEIATSNVHYKWFAAGTLENSKATFEDYEKILRPIFADKLVVSR